jgi:hypothetical protein
MTSSVFLTRTAEEGGGVFLGAEQPAEDPAEGPCNGTGQKGEGVEWEGGGGGETGSTGLAHEDRG